MFESCSGKVDLENPSDMFRLKENIEFIDMATNRVVDEEIRPFQQAMERPVSRSQRCGSPGFPRARNHTMKDISLWIARDIFSI